MAVAPKAPAAKTVEPAAPKTAAEPTKLMARNKTDRTLYLTNGPCEPGEEIEVTPTELSDHWMLLEQV